jgi:signal transduction histidine kinase
MADLADRIQELEHELAKEKRRYERLQHTAEVRAGISERNKNMMYRAHRALQLEVEERKETERRLREAHAAAEAATQAKSTFLAHMSHELRTPLSGIRGMMELASDDSAPKVTELLDIGLAAVDDLREMLDRLLDLASIEADRMELKPAPFRPAETVREACNVLVPLASRRLINVRIHDDGLPPWVRGDASRLRQLVRNLTGNALKFTPSGAGVDLEVDWFEDTLSVTIRDEGPGIPAERIDHIFEPFTRLDPAVSRDSTGSGLGLTIARHIARSMGGDVTCQSTVGQGSTFTLAVAAPRCEPVEESQGIPTLRGVGRVLIVEDNQVNQLFVRTAVERLGYEATVVGDAPEAVAAIQTEGFDLVLLDCQLPTRSGYSVARDVAAMALTRRPILVALTALARAQDRQRALATMDDYISKPVSIRTLAEVLGRHLGAN